MNCNECQSNFTALSKGRLDAALRRDVEAHLQDCATCAAAHAQTMAMFQELDRQEQPSVLLENRFRGVLALAASEAGDKHGRFTAHTANSRQAAKAASTAGSRQAGWFSRFWPSRPVWAFAYSLALFFTGAAGGQLLQINGNETLDTEANPTLSCPVGSPSHQWLPSNQLA